MSATVLDNRVVLTRSRHQCWGCLEDFPPGSRMRVCKCADGGVLSTTYWCNTCDAYVAEKLKEDRWWADDGLFRGCVRDDRNECGAERQQRDLDKLHRQVAEIRERYTRLIHDETKPLIDTIVRIERARRKVVMEVPAAAVPLAALEGARA